MGSLADIARRFSVPGRLAVVRLLGSGNVNDTYLAVFRTTVDERRIVLQRINRNVFRRPETIMENLRAITAHILPRLEREADGADRIWQLPAIVPTQDGHDWWTDDEGELWRALTLIDSSRAFDSA